MTLQRWIECVQKALAAIARAKEAWQSTEADASVSGERRLNDRAAYQARQHEFWMQHENVAEILAAHVAARKHVQEAGDKLASLMPQLRAMLETDPYIMRTVEEIHMALTLTLALEVERG